MKMTFSTQFLTAALLSSCAMFVQSEVQLTIAQLDTLPITQLKNQQLNQHRIVVKWKNDRMHNQLLQTPEGKQITQSRALNEDEKAAQLGELHLLPTSSRENGLKTLSDIYEVSGIKLKHVRSASLKKDVFWTQHSLQTDSIIERLMASGYFEHVSAIRFISKDSPFTVEPASLPSADHVASASLDTEAYNDPLYLSEYHLAEQGPWTMGHHDFAGASKQVEQIRTLQRKVRIAVIDTGSFPHEDIQWADDGADFVSAFTGEQLIGKCAMSDTDNTGLDMQCKIEDYLPLTRSMHSIDKEWHFASDEMGTPIGTGELCIDGHGLQVASTIAAVRNNYAGIVSAVDNNLVEIVPIRALTCFGGSSLDSDDAIVWAAGGEVPGMPMISEPVDVINLSLGSLATIDGCAKHDPTNGAIAFARSQGVVVVAASGNNGTDVDRFTPATCEGVLTVGANNLYGDLALFSNYGDAVDVTFTGTEITAATINTGAYEDPENSEFCGLDGSTPSRMNCYGRVSGTSFATPLASAAVALKKLVSPDLSEGELRVAVTSSASSYNTDERGLINRRGNLQPHAGIGNALRVLTQNPDVLAITETKAEHHFKLLDGSVGSEYLAQIVTENANNNLCQTYSLDWRSPAEAIDDIQFRVWLSNSEDDALNEQNSERLNPINARTQKHAIVDMSNHRRVAIQAINQKETGELIEVNLSAITHPSFCS